jgi:hypothetical protein
MAKTNNLCKTLKLHVELVLLSGEEMSLYVNIVYMCIHLFVDLSVCVWCVSLCVHVHLTLPFASCTNIYIYIYIYIFVCVCVSTSTRLK